MGARSPEAPTEPFSQMTGVTPLLSISTSVSVISRPDAGVAVGVHVDAACHGCPHHVLGRRLTDASGVVVDQEALKLLDLLVAEHHLGKLADARVGAVHDLARRDLLFEHGATDLDAFEGRRIELDTLAATGDTHDLLYRQRTAVQHNGHSASFLIDDKCSGYSRASRQKTGASAVQAGGSGPAAASSGAAASYWRKFSANIRASRHACPSYASGSGQASRGCSNAAGTPGTASGTSTLNSGSGRERDVVERARQRRRQQRAGDGDADALAGAVGAAGPAGVDQPAGGARAASPAPRASARTRSGPAA